MICNHCGGNLKTQHTSQSNGHVIRFRRCDKCGITVKTIEENPTQYPASGSQAS